LGWGAAFVDLDNHGWPDLLVANGHVYPEVDSYKLGSSYREARAVYRNLGKGKFKDISQQSGPGITQPAPSRGLAVGDLWNDGRMEAVINNISDHPMLLVNLAANRNHWLGVRLAGTQSNRDGIGSRVFVRCGSRSWIDEVRSGSSYSSSNDLRLHFGLGDCAQLESIRVRWPNGREETFPGRSADQIVTLKEGSGYSSK
jgi:hypothetical protein